MEQTLVFIKPDAVIRKYTGARLLKHLTRDADVVHYEVVKPSREFLADEHYAEHEGEWFYDWLIDYVSTSPLHVLILEGDGVIKQVRDELGDTVPNEADPHSLRGRYGIYGGINTTHASEYDESKENATREIRRWESILTSGLGNHQDRLDDYVDQYLDYPQVDPIRYREITTQYKEGMINEKQARETFTTLLARESNVSSRLIADLCSVLIANAELER